MLKSLKQKLKGGIAGIDEFVFDRQLPNVFKRDENLDITFKDFVREVPGAGAKITDTFIPGMSDFTRTTANIFGEGLAYAIDKNVREQYKKGNTDILPYITRTEIEDVWKKAGAAGIEVAVFKSISPSMRMKLLPRGGAGALQGTGFAIAEGLANDEDAATIIDRAKKYATVGSAVNIVTPYLNNILGKSLRGAPKEAVNQVKLFKNELKNQVPLGIQYKYPKAFERGIKEATIIGPERRKMAEAAFKKKFENEMKSLSTPGKIEHATYNLPNSKIKKVPVDKKAIDGSTYKAMEERLVFKPGNYSKDLIRDKYSKWQSPTSMTLWQDNVAINNGKFGEITKNLYYPMQESLGNYSAFQKTFAKRALDINKNIGLRANRKTGERMSDIMELVPNKDLQNLTSKQILKKYGELTPFKKLEVKHIDAAKEYRKLFDELKNSANDMRKLLGLNPIGELDRYLPHLQKVSAWDKVIRSGKDTNYVRARDFLTPNKVTNPHALQRVNDVLRKEPERNMFALYDRYVSSIGKDIYYNPAIKHLTTQTKALRNLGKDNTATFWEDQIRDGMVGKLSNPFFEKLAQIRAQAAIPGNILWAHTVQPSSLALTVKDQTYRDTLKGSLNYFTDKKTRRTVSELASIKIKDARGKTTIMSGSIGQQENMVYRPFSTKWTDAAGAPIQAMEKNLSGMSAAAGLEHGKKLGFKGQDLKIYASMAADMSQSMYNAGSRPLIMNNSAFRFVFPFKTFVLESQTHAMEMLGMAKAPLTGSLSNKIGYRLSQATGLLSSAYLLNKYNEKLRGAPVYTPGSFVMFSEAGEYAIEKITGKKVGRFSYGGRNPISPFQDFEQLLGAAEEAIDVSRKLQIESHDNMIELGKAAAEYAVSGDLRTFREQLIYWTMGLYGYAGSNQVNKSIDGLIAAQKEEVTDRAGAEMFKVEGIKDKATAVLFGVWQTKTGREYLEENEKLQETKIEQREMKTDITTLAQHYKKRIKSIEDEEERIEAYKYISKEFPEISEEMDRLAAIDEKGLTSIDKTLLQLNVKNWMRAREIERMLREMPEEERGEWYKKRRENKVISDEVSRQLNAMFENNPL